MNGIQGLEKLVSMSALKSKTIRFKSKDGLPITADLYKVDKSKGFILLCHRSHFNRGEYKETALKLNALGFSCMAIDQRSGMNVLGVKNETSTLAKQKGLPTGYLDARQDIEAAIAYLYTLNLKKPIILVGSSYSASLALLVACNNDNVKAVAAFSPSEYLKGVNLAESIRPLAKPLFITSAKKEVKEASHVVRFVHSKYVTQFKPNIDGAHGSRVLWEATTGNESYWRSFRRFLFDL